MERPERTGHETNTYDRNGVKVSGAFFVEEETRKNDLRREKIRSSECCTAMNVEGGKEEKEKRR